MINLSVDGALSPIRAGWSEKQPLCPVPLEHTQALVVPDLEYSKAPQLSQYCALRKPFTMSTSVLSINAESMPAQSASYRSYFYVGGQYKDNGRGDKQHVMTGQMYVEKLIPVHGVRHPWPLVFIHGAGQTGTVNPIPAFRLLLYLPRDLCGFLKSHC